MLAITKEKILNAKEKEIWIVEVFSQNCQIFKVLHSVFWQLFICEVKETQLLSTCLAFKSSQAKFVTKMQIRLMEACNAAESFSPNSKKESCMSFSTKKCYAL